MKFEDLQKEWDKDCVIEKDKLDLASINTPILHNKYYKYYILERSLLKRMEADLKVLELDKIEFFTQGPTKEQHDKGWVLPAKGVIIKSEVDKYLQADKEYIQTSLKVFNQKQKVEFLEAIIGDLNRRTFVVKNAIEFIKWEHGSS